MIVIRGCRLRWRSGPVRAEGLLIDDLLNAVLVCDACIAVEAEKHVHLPRSHGLAAQQAFFSGADQGSRTGLVVDLDQRCPWTDSRQGVCRESAFRLAPCGRAAVGSIWAVRTGTAGVGVMGLVDLPIWLLGHWSCVTPFSSEGPNGGPDVRFDSLSGQVFRTLLKQPVWGQRVASCPPC